MAKVRDKYRFMCSDLSRAALNRRIVKQKRFTQEYPTDAELKARGYKLLLHVRQDIP